MNGVACIEALSDRVSSVVNQGRVGFTGNLGSPDNLRRLRGFPIDTKVEHTRSALRSRMTNGFSAPKATWIKEHADGLQEF
jgi:hypothetical protein